MQVIRKNIFAIIVWTVGLLFAGVNIWHNITTDNTILAQRVYAIEQRNERVDPLVTEYLQSAQHNKDFEKQVLDRLGDLQTKSTETTNAVNKILIKLGE